MNIETSLQNTRDHEDLANRPRIKCRLWQKAQNSAGHKVHETSPSLKRGNLVRKESGIIILGNLDELCPHRQQKITRSLIKSILSFLDGMQVSKFYFLTLRRHLCMINIPGTLSASLWVQWQLCQQPSNSYTYMYI